MLRITSLIFALLVSWSACAQVPLTGAGKGAPGGVTYQGPGDVVASPVVFASCARVVDLAHASTTTSLCDLKDKTTGTVAICTLRGSSTGFVDLTGAYCVGSTIPAAACAAAAGGSCIISKAYDQTGNGHDLVQATAANMPSLTFSALNGLPGITFTSVGNLRLATAVFSIAVPTTWSTVGERTSGATTSAYINDNGNVIGIGPASSANTAYVASPTSFSQAASDNAWHAIQGLTGVTNGMAINIDGSDSGVQTSPNNASAGGVRIGRSGAGVNLDGQMMEAGIWGVGFTLAQRNNMNSNQHSATNGYNF